MEWHQAYQEKGLIVIGLATAFEDYDKNTLENLRRLVKTGEVIGETFEALKERGLLIDGKLEWRLPFAIGMDQVLPETGPVTQERILHYTRQCLPDFDELEEERKQATLYQVRNYLKKKTMRAETFERFALQGTPSSILFNRNGQLRDVSFGINENKQSLIEECLASTN